MRVFSENLKKERLFNNLTQQQMADVLGIPLKTYRSYESVGDWSRKPDMELLVKIADILKVSLDELLGRK